METNNKKLKFAMLFSGGKDSTIALGKMIRAGHIPVCIVVGKMTQFRLRPVFRYPRSREPLIYY